MGVASIEAFEAAASWFFTNGVMKAVFGSSDERTCTLLSTYIISFDGYKNAGDITSNSCKGSLPTKPS